MCFSLILRFWNNILHFAHHWGMCTEKKILFWLHIKFYFLKLFCQKKNHTFPQIKTKVNTVILLYSEPKAEEKRCENWIWGSQEETKMTSQKWLCSAFPCLDFGKRENKSYLKQTNKQTHVKLIRFWAALSRCLGSHLCWKQGHVLGVGCSR